MSLLVLNLLTDVGIILFPRVQLDLSSSSSLSPSMSGFSSPRVWLISTSPSRSGFSSPRGRLDSFSWLSLLSRLGFSSPRVWMDYRRRRRCQRRKSQLLRETAVSLSIKPGSQGGGTPEYAIRTARIRKKERCRRQ
jgi:hypothetical protein